MRAATRLELDRARAVFAPPAACVIVRGVTSVDGASHPSRRDAQGSAVVVGMHARGRGRTEPAPPNMRVTARRLAVALGTEA